MFTSHFFVPVLIRSDELRRSGKAGNTERGTISEHEVVTIGQARKQLADVGITQDQIVGAWLFPTVMKGSLRAPVRRAAPRSIPREARASFPFTQSSGLAISLSLVFDDGR